MTSLCIAIANLSDLGTKLTWQLNFHNLPPCTLIRLPALPFLSWAPRCKEDSQSSRSLAPSYWDSGGGSDSLASRQQRLSCNSISVTYGTRGMTTTYCFSVIMSHICPRPGRKACLLPLSLPLFFSLSVSLSVSASRPHLSLMDLQCLARPKVYTLKRRVAPQLKRELITSTGTTKQTLRGPASSSSTSGGKNSSGNNSRGSSRNSAMLRASLAQCECYKSYRSGIFFQHCRASCKSFSTVHWTHTWQIGPSISLLQLSETRKNQAETRKIK